MFTGSIFFFTKISNLHPVCFRLSVSQQWVRFRKRLFIHVAVRRNNCVRHIHVVGISCTPRICTRQAQKMTHLNELYIICMFSYTISVWCKKTTGKQLYFLLKYIFAAVINTSTEVKILASIICNYLRNRTNTYEFFFIIFTDNDVRSPSVENIVGWLQLYLLFHCILLHGLCSGFEVQRQRTCHTEHRRFLPCL